MASCQLIQCLAHAAHTHELEAASLQALRLLARDHAPFESQTPGFLQAPFSAEDAAHLARQPHFAEGEILRPGGAALEARGDGEGDGLGEGVVVADGVASNAGSSPLSAANTTKLRLTCCSSPLASM